MPKTVSKLKILYGEGDQKLLASQAATIQNAGHTVQTALGRKSVEETIRREPFDLVIVGHTLNKNDRHHLPYIVKKARPEARVLVLHSSGSHPGVDAELDTPHSIEAILQKISSLFVKAATVGA